MPAWFGAFVVIVFAGGAGDKNLLAYDAETGREIWRFWTVPGDPAKGYYSYDVGSWHLIALNSNCTIVACGADGLSSACALATRLKYSNARRSS